MVDRMFLVVLGLVAWAAGKPTRPPYIFCVDSSDCAKGECCTIGRARFATPVCRNLVDFGESCYPAEPFSFKNVLYPDGASVNLTNVYDQTCPCMGNLVCSADSGTCTDPTDLFDFNDIGNDKYDY